MNLFSFLPKPSLSTMFVGVMLIISAILMFSGYDAIVGKFGVETKASLQEKLAVANAQLAQLQSTNKELVAQISDQESRHKKEIKTVKEVLDHVIVVNKELTKTKDTLASQNSDLKKKIKEDQDSAYAKYNIDKDLYFVYLKADVDAMSSNNYDSLFSFVTNKVNGFQIQKPLQDVGKEVPNTKVASEEYEQVILAIANQEEN